MNSPTKAYLRTKSKTVHYGTGEAAARMPEGRSTSTRERACVLERGLERMYASMRRTD